MIEEDTTSVQSLHKALETNRLAHAVLIHGQNLHALEDLAFSLAGKLLECPQDNVSGHPDFFALRPVNKMRQISAENTRELIKSILKSSHQGGRKVSVVYEADRMNKSAANAFLKTLEGPPLNTTIFLLTSRPYALLDTIRSRCLNFRLPSSLNALQDPVWEEWLKHYEDWTLEAMKKPSSKKAATERVMGVYRLTLQFEAISSRLADESWEAQKQSLPEGLTDEESAAQKSGVQKNIRNRLLSEIEGSTYKVVMEHYGEHPPTSKLDSIIKKLEEMASLLEVNLNTSTALEAFLLHALRVWPS